MRVLLDTNVFLWSVGVSSRRTPTFRAAIDGADEVYVSAVSIWEAAIKIGLGKLQVDAGRLTAAMEESGFLELYVTAEHATRVAQLPYHHRDPFDRLLIAQAMTEPLVLLTADESLVQYSDLVRLVQ
jgi:PIN domain nuclease of toxin-antitoxin system